MPSMVNCKFFIKILYLIKKNLNYTIYTYQKGVMAARLEGGIKYLNNEFELILNKHKSI